MTKLLPAVCLVIAFLGILLYFRFFRVSTPAKVSGTVVPSADQSLELRPLTSKVSDPTSERLRALEEAVAVIIKKLAGNSTSSDVDTRIKSLETSVTDLKKQVNQLQQGNSQVVTNQSSTAPTVATSKSPVYIPLGWVGGSSAFDWTTITSQSMIIDPSDYSGYTSMQLEVNLRVFQGNGQAYARISNNDGTAILNSQVSTGSGDYNWVSSGGFTLPGKKTYYLQLKASTGYEAGVQNARIRVNF